MLPTAGVQSISTSYPVALSASFQFRDTLPSPGVRVSPVGGSGLTRGSGVGVGVMVGVNVGKGVRVGVGVAPGGGVLVAVGAALPMVTSYWRIGSLLGIVTSLMIPLLPEQADMYMKSPAFTFLLASWLVLQRRVWSALLLILRVCGCPCGLTIILTLR